MKANVLLVDDNSELREVLGDSLRFLGCECVSVKNGSEALEAVKNNNFTCIISDIQMPEMSGLEMIKKLKKQSVVTPVIFITGYSHYSDEAIEKEGGVILIQKPFRQEQVSEIVKRYIELLPGVA